MEGSKTFSKDFMRRHHIPTAAYQNFTSVEDAKRYLDSAEHNVVIKASGLAAGKGVIIPSSKEEAHAAVTDIMQAKAFGSAGDEIVIEEYLEGDELSILAFSDGYTIVPLPPAQDHKRIYDGDQGPNTGGMGCYAPTKIASKSILDQIHKTILQPTIDGMRKEGPHHYKGCVDYRLLEIRLSFCRDALHGTDDDENRPKGSRIQRKVWRSGDTNHTSIVELRHRLSYGHDCLH